MPHEPPDRTGRPDLSAGFYKPQRAVDVGDMVGSYTLTARLGSGGFGDVYKAHQSEPFEREVALKVMHRVTDAHRLQAEGQALAMMEHPNVATVFDAGVSECGVPFVAMESVDGEHITQYCTEHRLTTRQRLELFASVCRAVHHAHQKAIIHRDIKPSNVLVTELDDRPHVKVIDFGIAVMAGQYEIGPGAGPEMLGTPQYMSPEQFELPIERLDVRTDVYALGVLFYELLVDERPFDSESFRESSRTEIQRIIRDIVPQTLVDRLRSASAERVNEIAHNRQTTPAALRRGLRGDLSGITGKAMAKARDDRYGSASELADEVDRHLRHEPVEAASNTPWYRLRKLARRRRGLITASGVALIGLVVGLVVAVWQAVDATTARLEAEASADILDDILTGALPSSTQGEDLTVHDLVRQARATLRTQSADNPVVDARIRLTLGRTLFAIGEYRESEELLQQALAGRRRLYGVDDDRVLDVTNSLALTLWFQGQVDEAEELLRYTAAVRVARHGRRHKDTLTSLHNLGRLLVETGEYDEAEELLDEVLATRQETLGPNDPTTVQTLIAVAQLLRDRAEVERSIEVLREAVRRCRANLGTNNPTTLVARSALVRALLDMSEYHEALEDAADIVARTEDVYGADHLETITARNNYAEALLDAGMFGESEELHRQNLAILEETRGLSHERTLRTMNNLALALQRQRRFDEAEELYRRSLDIQIWTLGADHHDTLITRSNLATLLDNVGKDEEALPIYQEVLAALRINLPPDHHQTLTAWNNVCSVLLDLGEIDEAIATYEELIETYANGPGVDVPDALFVRYNYASGLIQAERYADARQELATLLDTYRRLGRIEDIVYTANALGRATLLDGDTAGAEGLFREAARIARNELNAAAWLTAMIEGNLGGCLVDLERFDEAEPLLLASHETLSGQAGLETQLERISGSLVRLYDATGRPVEAGRYQ